MARRLHFSRLLDLISGSALAAANTQVQKSALYKDFDVAKLESKKLRDLIDANLPTFYMIDIELIVEELSKNIGFSNFTENESYVSLKFPKKQELLKFLTETIEDSLASIPRKPFLPFLDKIENDFDNLIDKLSKRTSYIGYRNATTVFGSKLRSEGKALGVFIASDAEKIVNNLGKKTYVVIGPSFNAAVEKVNNALNTGIRKAFAKSYDINLKAYSAKANAQDRFTIGDYINAGHTAAFDTKNTLIGINMPFAQEKQFLLSGNPRSQGLELAIADLYLDANYGIKFNQNFTEKAGKMLDMQFSFVVTMPSKFNTSTLRTQEVSRIKEYIGNTILPSIIDQAKNKFKGGLLSDTINTGASPSTKEYINDLLVANIKGKKVNPIIKSSTTPSKKSTIKTHGVVKTDSKVKINVKSGGTRINAGTIGQATKAEPSLDLLNLTNLINNQLQDVISANMGDGSSRSVLNYRTGRFASTVNVERLSTSRQGMITAFYSYMKNPYATFSAGGRQSKPTSRDPKLLISKSIREIAEQVVTNKLRSVAV